MIYDLYASGLAMVEIGIHLGVTESRISQRMSALKTRLAADVDTREVMERFRDDPEFSLLRVRWITL